MAAGEIYLQAGQNIANSFSNAINQYHQEHVAYDQQSQIADALSRMAINPQTGGITMIDPDNPDKTLQPILDKKAVQMFQSNAHDQQVKATGALEALNRMGMASVQHLQEAGGTPRFFQGPGGQTLYNWGGKTGQISDPNAKADPDLDYTHAVNAYKDQLDTITSGMQSNFNVSPSDVLNSKAHTGYKWNPDTQKYVQLAKDQGYDQADAVQIQTGQGPQWVTKDQLQTLKPQAYAWQNLMQNPPQRSSYGAPRGGRGGAAGGSPIPIGQRGVVNGTPAVWGMAPGATRPGWIALPAQTGVVQPQNAPGAGPSPSPAPQGGGVGQPGATNIYGQNVIDPNTGQPVNPTAPQ